MLECSENTTKTLLLLTDIIPNAADRDISKRMCVIPLGDLHRFLLNDGRVNLVTAASNMVYRRTHRYKKQYIEQ